MASVGDNYQIEWVSYSRKEDGCCTHAVLDGSSKAVCGVITTESGMQTLIEAGGHVGCRRCAAILTKRGVLPLQVIEQFDHKGHRFYVAAD